MIARCLSFFNILKNKIYANMLLNIIHYSYTVKLQNLLSVNNVLQLYSDIIVSLHLMK